jgi:predicted nucleotidyltransferase
MNRSNAIARLSAHEAALRARGATALYLFGSVARDDPRARDVDLFIEYDPDSDFSLIELVGLKQFLEAELGTDVDITTRDSLHPLIRETIEQSAIRVF